VSFGNEHAAEALLFVVLVSLLFMSRDSGKSSNNCSGLCEVDQAVQAVPASLASTMVARKPSHSAVYNHNPWHSNTLLLTTDDAEQTGIYGMSSIESNISAAVHLLGNCQTPSTSQSLCRWLNSRQSSLPGNSRCSCCPQLCRSPASRCCRAVLAGFQSSR
jgi:hypothetical protein